MNTILIEQKLLKYCIDKLDLVEPDQFNSYFASIPLCVFNAIFSINTKYEAVLNALNRFCDYFNIKYASRRSGRIPAIKEQDSVSSILKLTQNFTPIDLATQVFKNRQRTSATNGILKADASIRFLKILRDFRVEYYQDIDRIINNETFDDCVRRIPGQGSGISLKYFFMLTGSKNQIKPDRMILGFIKLATGEKVLPNQAETLIRNVVRMLQRKGYKKLNPRHLDNIIWNYQRENNK